MQPKCTICGRFMRVVHEQSSPALTTWRCVKVWYAGEGQWEHD